MLYQPKLHEQTAQICVSEKIDYPKMRMVQFLLVHLVHYTYNELTAVNTISINC